jgi:beta-xylosidase
MGRGWRWPVYKEGNPVLTRFMNEVGFKGTFRTYIYLDRTNFGSGGRVRFKDFIYWLKKIHEQGGKLIITLIGMPRWLSSCRKDCEDWNQEYKWAMSPPKDYSQYEDLIFKVLKFYSVDHGLDRLYYEVWAEPDHPGYWRGSADEYLKLYHSFAKAARRINSQYHVQVKVGGAGTMSWNGYRGGGGMEAEEEGELTKTIIYRLIKYCGQKGLPIDFISFHRYDNDSLYHSTFRVGDRIRKWLKEFSLSPEIPIIMTEWNFYLNNKERNNEKGASFIPAMLYDMDKAGINYHTFFSIQDFDKIDSSPAGLGLFTLFGVAKPSYNVFRILSKLGPQRLKTTLRNDTNIGAIATYGEGDRMAILLWNYPQLEPVKVFERSLKHSRSLGPFLRGLRESKRIELLQQVGKIAQTEEYVTEVGRLGVDEEVQQDIAQAIGRLRYNIIGQTHPVKTRIKIKDPPKKDRLHYRKWVIDRERSNGYKDNMQFLKAVKMKALQEATGTVHNEGMSQEDLEKFIPLLGQLIAGAQEEDLHKVKVVQKKIEALPLSVKKNVKKVVDLFEKRLEDVHVGLYENFARQAQSINERPSVTLQQVDHKTVPFANPLEFSISMTPYSVTLITLE